MDYSIPDIVLGFFALMLVLGRGGGQALGGIFAALGPATPRDVEFRRAAGGVGMLTIAALLMWRTAALIPGYWQRIVPAIGTTIDALLSGKVAQLPRDVWVPVTVLLLVVGLILIGLFRLFVGWHRSRGPRDMVSATKALLWGLMTGALFAGSWSGAWWALMHHDWSAVPTINALLPWFYLWLTVKAATRLLLALRGPGGNAAKMVEKQIVEQSVAWRTGTRRQF
jgi:hypothetical protein